MKFFLLLFLADGALRVETRHRAMVGYALVDSSVPSRPWPKGHFGRLGASTSFRSHARYWLDLDVAKIRAGLPRRANNLPPGQGCHHS